MNTCSHCGRESHSSKPRCASCPADLEKMSADKEQIIIEPEVVRPHNAHHNQSHGQWSSEQNNSGFKMWTFQQYGGLNSRSNGSCLPSFITLGIALSLGVQFGILASIGFLVFYAIASAISFAISVRRMAQGQSPLLWFGRVAVWLICIFLTVTLAS